MRVAAVVTTVMLLLCASDASADKRKPTRGPLDPVGKIHMPIGIPNSVDTLKTFVEPEGCFSPGFGTYGIYVWVYDRDAKKLHAGTMEGVKCRRSLFGGLAVVSGDWKSGEIKCSVSICQVDSPEAGFGQVVAGGASVSIPESEAKPRRLRMYIALRPLGPAGGDVHSVSISKKGDALLVDGHVAVVARAWVVGAYETLVNPTAAGVLATDTVGQLAMEGEVPGDQSAKSKTGDCSGALVFDVECPPGKGRVVELICPVLPGRRAVGHKWDGVSKWAQLDLAKPNPSTGGVLQPSPSLDACRTLRSSTLYETSWRYWRRYGKGMRYTYFGWKHVMPVLLSHLALTMNEGAPDVAVVNYNVFNRDGMYAANAFQKAGLFDLSEKAIDYFLSHPFNGRSYPEADNPGQILWCMGEHWKFTRDAKWLKRVYGGAQKIAAMIEYYRTTPGPHWVQMDALAFRDDAPKAKRRKLEPGRCDGKHPEYTEAYDIAGLRAAAVLAKAAGDEESAAKYSALAERFMKSYDRRFGGDLAKKYGSYCVLWPCRLYPFGKGKAHEQFRKVGAQKPRGWRYFPLAKAHQGLLAGNREAAWETIRLHRAHPQMHGWYEWHCRVYV